MPIARKRVYDDPAPEDGYRVLVDRLWPRGLSKSAAKVDEWRREIAPADPLRKAYHRGEVDWSEFRRRYLAELKGQREALRPLAERARRGKITLLYSSRRQDRNNAVVLEQYLKMLGGG